MLTANVSQGIEPLTVQLDGSASSDADSIDTIASYTFNFGDGSDDVMQTTPTIGHTFDAGEYIVRLVVTDSRGKGSSNTAHFKVDVASAEPTPTPTPTPTPSLQTADASSGMAVLNVPVSQGRLRYQSGESEPRTIAVHYNTTPTVER